MTPSSERALHQGDERPSAGAADGGTPRATQADGGVRDWFLSRAERGNPPSIIDETSDPGTAWTAGNSVRMPMHGSEYFSRLAERLSKLEAGDEVMILDWRGDEDERLGPEGPTLGEVVSSLPSRGVKVRGLLWRSHPRLFGFSEEGESELARLVNEAGGELLLDERVRRGGSHHQKLVLIRTNDGDRAFVGGVDLCHGRRDSEEHPGDPQSERLNPAFGEHPPWHDLQVEISGPAVESLACTFEERWNDKTPLEENGTRAARIHLERTHEPASPPPAATPVRHQDRAGDLNVQVLRTYPVKRTPYPFAPSGERSVARLYRKVLRRASSLIYLEDQYFWSREVGSVFEEVLGNTPDLRLIVVVPRHPDRDGLLSGPANRIGQLETIERLSAAAPGRVAVYDLENQHGKAIYVHAKVVVIDDHLVVIGSDNLNRRSWTHDSELSLAIIDDERDRRRPTDLTGRNEGARRFARDLRLGLWREHLGNIDEIEALDPQKGFELWDRTAEALEDWHARGREGPRPPGQVRVHRPESVAAWQRVWAEPFYRLIVDPDGRPRELRRSGRF